MRSLPFYCNMHLYLCMSIYLRYVPIRLSFFTPDTGPIDTEIRISRYELWIRINRFTGIINCFFSNGNCNWIFNRAASRSVAGLGTLPLVDLEPEQRAMPLKLKGMPLAKGTRYARGLPLKQAMLLTFFRLYCSRSPASCPLPHLVFEFLTYIMKTEPSTKEGARMQCHIVKKRRDRKLIVGSVAGSDPTDSKYPTGGGP